MNYKKILKEFIEIERVKMRVGSGDDGLYEQQIIDFGKKHEDFLIDFIKFIEKKLNPKNKTLSTREEKD